MNKINPIIKAGVVDRNNNVFTEQSLKDIAERDPKRYVYINKTLYIILDSDEIADLVSRTDAGP